MSPKFALSTSCMFVLIVMLVISFQPVSTTPEREACVAGLVQLQANPEMMGGWPETTSNALICLALNEGRDACVSRLVQMQGNPNATVTVIDTTSNAIECLSLDESNTPERKACVTELVQIQVNPNVTLGELVDTISNAVVCLART